MDIADLADLEHDLTPLGASYGAQDFARLDASYGARDFALLGASYTELVDVREIADAASVSEGSVMSIIDWDQVDQLIADIH